MLEHIRKNVDMDEVRLAIKRMYKERSSFGHVNPTLHDQIYDLLEEYGEENDLPEEWWESEFEIEEVLFELL